jgi:erythromycin esterase-like protein
VVSAHNSHIGNAAATVTAMGWEGKFNIGELCCTAFDEGAALIGFGTDRGTVAALDRAGPMEHKRVRPALPGSHEALFRDSGVSSALLDPR